MAESRPFGGSDAPTPPTGMQAIDPEDVDASQFSSLGDLINAEDVGPAAPSVLGAPEPSSPEGDAGDWPKLEYRSRNKPERPKRSNPLNLFRRKDR
ncbi:hypothetical protein [Saccharopolyspora hordei]|uniref:Uncharacterized protein n=1 Tax=Saccharopolyspora hordei TaxID=1838 RepID=A0A853AQZ3_9PSEU|nr:hypothetical protein [Saccharopolyspora hordei]NYI83371.1 hypothetical protein [Saccharopolyspora hordei]